MDHIDLYRATSPVFTHYLRRLQGLVECAENGGISLYSRLVPDTFCAGEHFHVAQGFVMRTVFPVIGQCIPVLENDAHSADGLRRRHEEITDHLGALTPSDFHAASERMISHRAGEEDLRQNATDFVSLYGIPNFLFHLTMGYATLRQQGLKIGKPDFDGLHSYSPGFSFQS